MLDLGDNFIYIWFRMWASLTILFWSLFGLIELSSFGTEDGAETSVGLVLLALWLVLAVIILLSMLIALISNAFQRVQVNGNSKLVYL